MLSRASYAAMAVDFHRRGATDLRHMVADASGGEVQPGGDMGPARRLVDGLADRHCYNRVWRNGTAPGAARKVDVGPAVGI